MHSLEILLDTEPCRVPTPSIGTLLGSLSPVCTLSMVLHAAGLPSLAVAPGGWLWVLGTLAANHAVLGAAGMVPRSRVLGPNLIRLSEAARARGDVAITFDDGPDPQGTPRVLAILERYGVAASFFCVGSRAAREPGLTRDIAARGHDVENHTNCHPGAFALFGPRALAAEIGQAQAVLGRLSGRMPRFFRAPMGLRSPLLDVVLRRLGLSLVSWTRRGLDGRPADPAAVLRRLTTNLAAGDVLVLHDGGPSGGRAAAEILPRLLDTILARGLRPVSLAQGLAACATGATSMSPARLSSAGCASR